MDESNHNAVLTDLTGNTKHQSPTAKLPTAPRYNLRTRRRQPLKRMSKAAATRASKRLAANSVKCPRESPTLRTPPTTPDSDTVAELLETSEEEEECCSYKPQPPKPEEYPSIMTFVLRDTCRRRYGAEWETNYNDPSTRQALRAEVRNHLAEEIEHSTFVSPAAIYRDTNIPCQCYLHKYFGADKRLTFPNCHLQPRQDSHQLDKSQTPDDKDENRTPPAS